MTLPLKLFCYFILFIPIHFPIHSFIPILFQRPYDADGHGEMQLGFSNVAAVPTTVDVDLPVMTPMTTMIDIEVPAMAIIQPVVELEDSYL